MGHWVTINGTHVLIDKDGNIAAGGTHFNKVKGAISKHKRSNGRTPNTKKEDAYATKTLARAFGARTSTKSDITRATRALARHSSR